VKDSAPFDTHEGTPGEVSSDQKLLQQQQQHERAALQQKISQYECGERGHLNPVFPGAMRDWLDHCYKLGTVVHLLSAPAEAAK
jgi:hypothetical protein